MVTVIKLTILEAVIDIILFIFLFIFIYCNFILFIDEQIKIIITHMLVLFNFTKATVCIQIAKRTYLQRHRNGQGYSIVTFREYFDNVGIITNIRKTVYIFRLSKRNIDDFLETVKSVNQKLSKKVGEMLN